MRRPVVAIVLGYPSSWNQKNTVIQKNKGMRWQTSANSSSSSNKSSSAGCVNASSGSKSRRWGQPCWSSGSGPAAARRSCWRRAARALHCSCRSSNRAWRGCRKDRKCWRKKGTVSECRRNSSGTGSMVSRTTCCCPQGAMRYVFLHCNYIPTCKDVEMFPDKWSAMPECLLADSTMRKCVVQAYP